MSIPHLRIPFRIDHSGSAETVEQDSLEEVAQCVQVLLSTPIGTRIEIPTYGVPSPVFTANLDQDVPFATAQVQKWEPRAEAVLASNVDTLDQFVRHTMVTVRKATTNDGH